MRSRAEVTCARWLRDHGVRYEYERWHYLLPTGEGYVPDLWLPDVGTFLEVKAGNVDALHKPWLLDHVIARDEGLRVFLWSYGVTWRTRKFGWSSDVLWVSCPACGVTYPTPPNVVSCRGCGESRMTYVPPELRKTRWRARDPIRRWSPSSEVVRSLDAT